MKCWLKILRIFFFMKGFIAFNFRSQGEHKIKQVTCPWYVCVSSFWCLGSEYEKLLLKSCF